MKLFREVKAGDRLPEERIEVHIINNRILSSGFIQDGQWYLGEHETPVIAFSGVWLEPIEITEEDIYKIVSSEIIVQDDIFGVSMESARQILSKLKGDDKEKESL